MVLQIAVVDDETHILVRFKSLLTSILDHLDLLYDINLFSDGKAFIDSYHHIKYDMVFLDIDMPDINGMEIAAKLRQMQVDTTLIFVSSYDHFVFESIRYTPFRFVRKTMFDSEITEAVKSYLEKTKRSEKTITLRDERGVSFTVPLMEIMGFYAVRHDIYLYKSAHESIRLGDGRDLTMEKLEQLTTSVGFLRPHKSWLINYRIVSQIHRDEIILMNGESIPMSRRKTQEIRQQYSVLMREEDRI